jgi:hypothetical protein
MDEGERVDAAHLPDAIHAPDALLQPTRRPGQLETHHESAGRVQVEALARGVGAHERAHRPRGEGRDHRLALAWGQPAVERRHGGQIADGPRHLLCDVAVFAEDEDRLARPPQESAQTGHLGASRCGRSRQRHEPLQRRHLAGCVVEPRRGKQVFGHGIFAIRRFFPRQQRPFDGGMRTGEQGQPTR